MTWGCSAWTPPQPGSGHRKVLLAVGHRALQRHRQAAHRRRRRLQPHPESRRETVPFTFLIQSLMIIWYAISCDPAAAIGAAGPRPWYRTKATPSPADMHAALRGELTDARINSISPGHHEPPQITTNTSTSEATAA